MNLIKKHFKKTDSWMYVTWVRHDGFGLIPRLRVNADDGSIYEYFDFTWWRLHCYWVKGSKKKEHMVRTSTTIEESRRLLDLGIDPNTADMRWRYDHNTHSHDDIPQVLTVRNWDDPYNKDIPAWSLEGLLQLLPDKDDVDVTFGKDGDKVWADNLFAAVKRDTYIGAMVRMIEILVEKGCINVKEG